MKLALKLMSLTERCRIKVIVKEIKLVVEKLKQHLTYTSAKLRVFNFEEIINSSSDILLNINMQIFIIKIFWKFSHAKLIHG
jgi:hypothetical protein